MFKRGGLLGWVNGVSEGRPKVIERIVAVALGWAGGSAGAAAPAAQEIPSIPLRTGLQIVTAVNSRDGDYESIKTLESADCKAVRFHYSAEAPMVADDMSDEPPEPSKYRQYRPHPTDPNKWITILNVYRNVLRADLDAADHYLQVFTELGRAPRSDRGSLLAERRSRHCYQELQGSRSDATPSSH